MHDGPISRFRILVTLGATVILGFGAQSADAQTWVNSYDGIGYCGGDGAVHKILQTSDGGFIFWGVIGNVSPCQRFDYRLVKVDAYGVVEWSKLYLFNLKNNPAAGGALETSDGGFLLSGTVKTSSGCESDNVGLIKVDANGTVQWHRSYGLGAVLKQHCRDNWEYGGGLAEAGDGGYLVLGQRETNPLADPPAGQESQSSDLWLVKVDINGDLIWQKSYGGAGRDWLPYHDLIEVMDGGDIVIAGRTDSFGPNPGAVLVARLDADGVIVWERSFRAEQGAIPYSLVATGDSVLVVAALQAGVTKTWLVKLSSMGVFDWQRVIEYPNPPGTPSLSVYPYRAEQTSDGGFAIFGGMMVWGRWDLDPLLLKVDSTGGFEWGLRYAITGLSEWATAGAVTSDGGFVFGGSTFFDYDQMILRTDASGMINGGVCDFSFIQTLQSNNTDIPFISTNLTTLVTTSPQWNETISAHVGVEFVNDFCYTPVPIIHVDPNPLNFGNVPLGSVATRTLQVSNDGDFDLEVYVTSPVGSEMTLANDSCQWDYVSPGMHCSLELDFAPTATGWVFDQITIESNDPVNPVLTVTLSGFGGVGGIFADGFESSDITTWSAANP